MLKKLAVKILKKEIKKLNPEKIVDTLLELLEDKAREFLPQLIKQLQEKIK